MVFFCSGIGPSQSNPSHILMHVMMMMMSNDTTTRNDTQASLMSVLANRQHSDGRPVPVAFVDNSGYFTGGYLDVPSHGIRGLANQGSTCYLNSLLQTLYMLPEFRTTLFRHAAALLDHDNDDAQQDKNDKNDKNVSANGLAVLESLANLFARMQSGAKGSCDTSGVTRAFGWDNDMVFEQHDVQELFHKLVELLEKQLGVAPAPGVRAIGRFAADAFYGMSDNYLQCLTCKNQRNRVDSFMDISLPIDKSNDLSAALRAFLQPELLEKGNMVRCDQCNGEKQPAEKGKVGGHQHALVPLDKQ